MRNLLLTLIFLALPCAVVAPARDTSAIEGRIKKQIETLVELIAP